MCLTPPTTPRFFHAFIFSSNGNVRQYWRRLIPILEHRCLHLLSTLALGGLVDERLVDVGDNSSSGDGGLDEGVKLLVSADGELQMPGGDTLHLKVLARVSGKLEDLSSEVLKDGRSVDGGGGSDTLSTLDGSLQEPVDTTDGELKSGLAGPGLGCLLRGGGLSSLSSLSSCGNGIVSG